MAVEPLGCAVWLVGGQWCFILARGTFRATGLGEERGISLLGLQYLEVAARYPRGEGKLAMRCAAVFKATETRAKSPAQSVIVKAIVPEVLRGSYGAGAGNLVQLLEHSSLKIKLSDLDA